jgi:flagellar biosynthesis/type III secretory pathway chaperone
MNTKEELTTILKEETEIAEALDTLLKSKQRAFIKWNTGELSGVMEEELFLLNRLSFLEKQRTTIFSELNQETGQEGTLKEYLKHYPSPELESQYERLKTISESVVKKNNQNQQLLKSSMSFVNNTLKTITDNYQRQLLDQKV